MHVQILTLKFSGVELPIHCNQLFDLERETLVLEMHNPMTNERSALDLTPLIKKAVAEQVTNRLVPK